MNSGKTLFAQLMAWVGTSENAVKSQVWCAVATCALIAIAKKQLQIEASIYTMLQVFSVSVFEKTELRCAFADPEPQIDNGLISKSLFPLEI